MFTKNISHNEYGIIQILQHTNIVPTIITLSPSSVIMVKYPTNLADYIEENNFHQLSQLNQIPNQIMVLIDQLHLLDIFHGDIHTGNIVLNPETNDVKIVDFGESRRISRMKQSDIKFFNEVFDINPPLTEIQQLIEFERTMLEYF
jgi:serine/threonine protein kinase